MARGRERTEQYGKILLKTKGWSIERRVTQSARCSARKPWENATGPRTVAGKAASRMNAERHGFYSYRYADLSHALLAHRMFLNKLTANNIDLDEWE